MSKGSLNHWTAQTFLNVQPFRSFEKYNSMPKARPRHLKMRLFGLFFGGRGSFGGFGLIIGFVWLVGLLSFQVLGFLFCFVSQIPWLPHRWFWFLLYWCRKRCQFSLGQEAKNAFLSGTGQASLAAKTNCETTLHVLFYQSKKIHCSAGLRPIISKYVLSRICV